MKRLILALWCLLPIAAFGQVTGSIPSTNASACISIGVGPKASTVAVQIAGTWTGTLQPKVSVQGQTPANTQVTPSTSTTAQATITANGIYTATVAAYDTFMVCGNTVASGTANVFLNVSTASASGKGGGGATSLAGLLGGSAPAGQTYDFQTNADVVNVVTKALGTNTTDAASMAAVQTAINNAAFTKSGIYATTYGAVGEGHFQFGATFTNTSNIVTCPTCNFNTDATIGQAVYGTNLAPTGASSATVIQLPETTILSIDSNTQIHTVGNASASNAGNGFLAWGTYEDTQFENAIVASYAACTTLNLPALNPEGDGPAVIFLKAGHFITDPPCEGSGGARTGWGIAGYGTNASYLMPTPSFDATTCTGGLSQCFGPQGNVHRIVINYSGFSVFGGGNSNPGAGFATKIAFLLGATDNSYAHDVQLLFWGANATNGIGVGLGLHGGEILTYNVGEDGFGQVGRKYIAASNLGPISEMLPVAYDNGLINVYVNTDAGNPVFTTGGNYGTAAQVACANNGAIWNSSQDQFGLSNSGTANNTLLLGFCTDHAGTTNGNATVRLANDLVYGHSMGAGGHTLYQNATGDNVWATNTLFFEDTARTLITNNGSFIDGGGNTYTQTGGGTFTSGTGYFSGCLSCVGTAQTAGNVALTSGWGTANVNTVTGDSRNQRFIISITGGVPAAGPVATITLPTSFLSAPICNLQQIGGTFGTVTNPAHVVAISGAGVVTDAITFGGTPVSGQSYTFVETCQ